MKTIGLFPLNIVLFPGSSYPLHIYEPRYKVLIREAIASDGEFGIVLVEAASTFEVGCSARVAEILKEYEDGRMDVVVSGIERFQVVGELPREKPYRVAKIEPLHDQQPKPDPRLLTITVALYNELVEAVYGEAEEQLRPTEWMWGGGSFRIAQKAGLDLAIRQQLLEMTSEDERLTYLNQYLADLVPKVRSFEKIQGLIRNDGYVR